MSRSRKDGRRGGGHRNWWGREVWSKRFHRVTCWDIHTQGWKRLTHRYERRVAKADIQTRLVSDAP